MSYSICFDRVAQAKRILRSGIAKNSDRAGYELREAAWYLTQKTLYRPGKIRNILKDAGKLYFDGMPDEYIDKTIDFTLQSVTPSEDVDEEEHSGITIYQQELDAIGELGHMDTERLAFAYLCYAKYKKHNSLYECKSALYRLAWGYDYDDKKKRVLGRHTGLMRVSTGNASKRLTQICSMDIVQFRAQNQRPKNTIGRMSIYSKFSVPILQNEGDVAFVIDRPDDDLVLYYDRHKGYHGIGNCVVCGRPIVKIPHNRKYCDRCSESIKNPSKKKKARENIGYDVLHVAHGVQMGA